MDGVDEHERTLFFPLEMEQIFSVPWEYGTNLYLSVCFMMTLNNVNLLRGSDSPMYAEQPQNLLVSPLPSQVTTGGFAVPTGPLQYPGLHSPNATRAADFDLTSNPGSWQSQWRSEMNSDLTRASLPQLHNPHQIPQILPCGWSRDLEPSIPPGIPQSLPTALTPSYSNAGQSEAWMCHFLGGSADTYTSSPDWDGSLSGSGFLRSFDNYDFHMNACVDPQPSTAMAHNALPSIQSTALPSSEPICDPESWTRIYRCKWLRGGGVTCEEHVAADRRGVVEHLQQAHGMRPGEEKIRQKCSWEDCQTTLNKESLARHILTVHLKEGKERIHCPECGQSFAREDSLKRHLKGGHHKAPSEKSAGRVLPTRNDAGSSR